MVSLSLIGVTARVLRLESSGRGHSRARIFFSNDRQINKNFKLIFLSIFLLHHLVLSCTILCSTAFCRLSNDSQRRITQTPRIDIDGAAYRLHGQKLAGRAFRASASFYFALVNLTKECNISLVKCQMA